MRRQYHKAARRPGDSRGVTTLASSGAAAQPGRVELDRDSWGIDHGTWSVLAHVLPAADVPVLQLSIHADAPLSYHLGLGARLAPLRERGVFILGSGNVVHNLRRIDWSYGDRGLDWSERFDAHVRSVMTSDPRCIGRGGEAL